MSPVPTDPYDFTNGGVADAEQVDARFAPLYTALNGALDATNLAAALKSILGVSDSGVVRRGKSIIATEESRTNAAYGLLTTPDRVSGVELPTDGLLLIAYSALWKNSVAGAGRAAIFLGANQLKIPASAGTGVPVVQEADGPGAADKYGLLYSVSHGLWVASGIVDMSLVTTGLAMPATSGICVVQAAAGTYDVSVQFKSASGSVSAKSRKLWVWTRGF
jgi:hypothetical protein